jgi:hypothetical protein
MYTAVVLARNTGPNRPDCEFRVLLRLLRRLREKVRRRRPELWREQTWLLHHDNDPSHTSVLTQQFLAKHKITFIPYAQYSPDLAPCDLSLFPKIKLKLKGRRFDTTGKIQAESQSAACHWQKRTSRKRSINEGDRGTGVYTREGTTSRVMAADRPYGEFYYFYNISLEYFWYISYHSTE